MWKCSTCQNENKDEYRFCLNCGSPRPEPPEVKQEKERRTKRKTGVVTVLLLILSLLLIIAIVAIIINFPALSEKAAEEIKTSSERSQSRQSTSETSATEKPEKGGTSTFIFGGDEPASASAPVVPQPEATAAPTPSPIPTPTPAPTAAPTGDYLIPDSDSRYITEDDLKNLSWEQCCLARNEIFARHGRIFVTKEIADYFNSKSWYKGTVSPENFSDTVLNAFEKANINTISQYEKTRWGGSYY